MSDDVTGQRRIGANTLAIWAGQVVVIVTGFIIPRLIDRNLSQAELGIWDFGWTAVSYFRLMGLGMAAGLNRYVALYNAQERRPDLIRAVSSTALVQVIVALLTGLLALAIGEFAYRVFLDSGPEFARSARWLIALLGAGIAVRMYGWTARGILTGFHLWSRSATVTACGDILLLALMITTLTNDGGLISLGMCYAGTAVATEFVRIGQARRVYGLRFLKLDVVDRAMLKKLLVFGIKTNAASLPLVIVMTAVSMTLAAGAGPAALAVYARPLALAKHSQALVGKFTNILTSTSASLLGLGDEEKLRSFFLSSAQAATSMSLPLLLIVGIYGDVMVDIWMGSDYVDPWLAPLICAGLLVPTTSMAAQRVLIGLNQHGRVGLLALVAALVLLAICITTGQYLGWTPRVAAVAGGVCLTGSIGLFFPYVACQRLNVPLVHYLSYAFGMPALLNLPFAAALLFPKLYVSDPSLLLSAATCSIAGLLLALAYWKWLLSSDVRANILSLLPDKLIRSRAPPA